MNKALKAHELCNDSLLYDALDHTDNGMIIISNKWEVLFWNQWMEYYSEIPRANALGQRFDDIFSSLLTKRLRNSIEQSLKLGRSSLLSEKLNKSPLPLFRTRADKLAGKRMNQMITVKPLPLSDKTFHCLINISDVSKSVQREEVLQEIAIRAKASANRLRINEEHLNTIFESVQDGILTFDEQGHILKANHNAAALFQLSQARICTTFIHDLIEELHTEVKQSSTDINTLLTTLCQENKVFEFTGRRFDASTFCLEFTLSRIQAIKGIQYVSTIRDITEKRYTEQKLVHLAKYDPLTDLPNRVLFCDRLEHAMKSASSKQKKCILFFIDLDRFKAINEDLGHKIGDAVLIETAKRIKSCLKQSDSVARLGGDEFTIILEDVEKPETSKNTALKLIEQFKAPMFIEHHEIYIGISIGIAIYPDSANSSSELLRNADIAMYKSKSQGSNQFYYFSHEMNEVTRKRIALEADLHKAIDNNEFHLCYQPQVRLEDNKCIGAEALLRWVSQERGFISPAQFIPIAEESGFIIEIGQWVFEQACKTAKKVIDSGFYDFRMSVNISPKEFNQLKDCSFYINMVEKYGIQPHNIDIEITEGSIMNDTQNSITLLTEFSQAGFHLSVDDFGTGYSSLAYLHRFPLDVLKIDQSFIQSLPFNPDSVVISQSIIHLAHSLGLHVIAEGVETTAQVDFLRENSTDIVQGFLYSKPLKEKCLMQWLSQKNL